MCGFSEEVKNKNIEHNPSLLKKRPIGCLLTPIGHPYVCMKYMHTTFSTKRHNPNLLESDFRLAHPTDVHELVVRRAAVRACFFRPVGLVRAVRREPLFTGPLHRNRLFWYFFRLFRAMPYLRVPFRILFPAEQSLQPSKHTTTISAKKTT